jgi:hypothetical protein
MVVELEGRCKKQTPYVIGASKPSTKILTLTRKGIYPFLYFPIIYFLIFLLVWQST